MVIEKKVYTRPQLLPTAKLDVFELKSKADIGSLAPGTSVPSVSST